MTLTEPARLQPPSPARLLPCAESCVYFSQIHPDRWSEFGLCTNPRAPLRGYPIRLDRSCRDFATGYSAHLPAGG